MQLPIVCIFLAAFSQQDIYGELLLLEMKLYSCVQFVHATGD